MGKQQISKQTSQTSQIITAPNATNAYYNQGNGLQVANNSGTINVNCEGTSIKDLLRSILFSDKQKNVQNVSHAVEWASLNKQYYNLFVLENENFSTGSFSISKERSLERYTTSKVKEKFSSLSDEAISVIQTMPCIFVKRNVHYKETDESFPALIGRITEVHEQGDNIKILFVPFQTVPQQLLNQNVALLKMAQSSLRNELDEEHWAIKECNLIHIFSAMGITIL